MNKISEFILIFRFNLSVYSISMAIECLFWRLIWIHRIVVFEFLINFCPKNNEVIIIPKFNGSHEKFSIWICTFYHRSDIFKCNWGSFSIIAKKIWRKIECYVITYKLTFPILLCEIWWYMLLGWNFGGL